MAVEVLPARSERMVVRGSAWRAAIDTSRRSTPASSIVVTKVCLSMGGCMRGGSTPACSARRRSRRMAQCLSIRDPQATPPRGRDDRLDGRGGRPQVLRVWADD